MRETGYSLLESDYSKRYLHQDAIVHEYVSGIFRVAAYIEAWVFLFECTYTEPSLYDSFREKFCIQRGVHCRNVRLRDHGRRSFLISMRNGAITDPSGSRYQDLRTPRET